MTRESAIKRVKGILVNQTKGRGKLVAEVRSESDPERWYKVHKIRRGFWTCACKRWELNAVAALKKEDYTKTGNPKIFPCKHQMKLWGAWKNDVHALDMDVMIYNPNAL
jgi:hypothetical protein